MSKKFQLKNGLKVLLIESHKSPVVSVQMWVKTGSADEVKKEEGLSHFIEHLVFKGTEKFKVGEIASIVEGSGGELNAYTSFDQTVFYVTISKKFASVGLDVVSQMMGFPTFDSNEIDNEREVVIEEIKRGEDSPQRQIGQLLFSTAYKKHAYKVPVIGYADNIRKVSTQKIKQYFQSRYVPRNMFLVVSGDFKSTEMKKEVETYFGKFKDFKVKKVKRIKEPIQKKIAIAIKKSDFQETLTYVAFKAPNIKHKDIPGLDVLSLILGQGDSSRLVHKLRIEEAIVNGTGAFTFTPQDDGLVAFSGSLQPANLEKYMTILTDEIAEIYHNPPTYDEIQKAVTNIASEQVYSVETVDGLARKAGSQEFFMGDAEYYKKYLAAIYGVKPADITKLAKKYFDPSKMTISILSKRDEKEVKTIVNQFVKNLKAALKDKKRIHAKPKEKAKKIQTLKFKHDLGAKSPETEKISLNKGVTLYLREQKETPTCSIKMAFLGGTRIENEKLEGLSELYSRVWPAGSKNYTENQINLKLDTIAASMSCFSGRNTVGISVEFLSTFQKEMLTMLTDTIQSPIFDAKIIEREKMIQKNQIQSQSDNPSQVCIKEFMKMMFPHHPYSREVLGTKESLDLITRQAMLDYHARIFNHKNVAICAVGDFNRDGLVENLNSLIEHMPDGKKQEGTTKLDKVVTDQFSFKELKKEQSHIIVGYRGLSFKDEERYTLDVIQSILAGQGGRLFFELRDKNSLAYSVSPLKMAGVETGYFGAYIGCSPEKSKKAIQMIKDEFAKLCNTKVGADELIRSQRYLAGRNDIDLQRKGSICNSILFDVVYGLDADETFKSSSRYFEVTAEDVQALSQKIFLQNSVISVVGPSY
ncbi:MAG: insulinase family protein [Bdellovibrionaceae bacterium]|nr:insulinase family protein [Pseudobdellovibrionaceae bacterium]